jgi:threonylcarbamoyladenosine tRNA methylthiotransferase MtaB
LSSIEPLSLSPKLLELMAASNGRVCAHLHIPLQSGSSRVLSKMRRGYDAESYAAIVAAARRHLPKLALSTDVIVGFPGESEQEFAQTLELCSALGFSRVHVFRYSRRPGTAAAQLPGQLDAPTIAHRSHALLQLAAKLSLADMRSRIHSQELVLVDKPGQGRTESYHQVELAPELAPLLPAACLYRLFFSDCRNGKLIAATGPLDSVL